MHIFVILYYVNSVVIKTLSIFKQCRYKDTVPLRRYLTGRENLLFIRANSTTYNRQQRSFSAVTKRKQFCFFFSGLFFSIKITRKRKTGRKKKKEEDFNKKRVFMRLSAFLSLNCLQYIFELYSIYL